jgi:hypothetical protein
LTAIADKNLICISVLHIQRAATGTVMALTNSVDTTFFSLELLRRIPRSPAHYRPELHQQLTDAGIERNVRTILAPA